MPLQIAPLEPHPPGAVVDPRRAAAQAVRNAPLPVDTHGRRYHVEWDPAAPVTPLGQLVFCCQFLATAGLFQEWVRTCPLQFTSNNAPTHINLLGTIVLAGLSGHQRYSHVTALRADRVNPPGLGMDQMCSEDSVRRAFTRADPVACANWHAQALRQTYLPALRMDLDATVKTIYGHQEGAEVGYNPHKRGRPSHVYHSLFVRGLRLVLNVDVRPGKQHGATHSRPHLWHTWDELPFACRPWLLCGDSSYGHEGLLAECEVRDQRYLFRVRHTKGVRQLVQLLERQGGRQPTVNGWEGAEGRLQLTGWTRRRRVVGLRRLRERPPAAPVATPLLTGPWLTECGPTPLYEYQVLVTDLTVELLTEADRYRQRAAAENSYDELKNHWGWGGFTTHDLLRCQVTARHVALVYNWWSLFVRCVEPTRAREAVTSRPLLLSAVGRVLESGRQFTLRLTSTHGDAAEAQTLLTNRSTFLTGLKTAAEQLTPAACWERIWARILAPLLLPQAVLPVPSG